LDKSAADLNVQEIYNMKDLNSSKTLLLKLFLKNFLMKRIAETPQTTLNIANLNF